MRRRRLVASRWRVCCSFIGELVAGVPLPVSLDGGHVLDVDEEGSIEGAHADCAALGHDVCLNKTHASAGTTSLLPSSANASPHASGIRAGVAAAAGTAAASRRRNLPAVRKHYVTIKCRETLSVDPVSNQYLYDKRRARLTLKSLESQLVFESMPMTAEALEGIRCRLAAGLPPLSEDRKERVSPLLTSSMGAKGVKSRSESENDGGIDE